MVLEQIKASFVFSMFFFGFIIGYFLKRFLDEKDGTNKTDEELEEEKQGDVPCEDGETA